MKKASLLLFVTGLLILSIVGTDCARKNSAAVPLGTGTIIKTKVDSSGEDICVSVDLNTVVSGGGGPASNARLRLFNNFNDLTAFESDTNYKSKSIIISTCNGQGLDTFHKVKPWSVPAHSIKGTNSTYNYYIKATYIYNGTVPPTLWTGSIGSYSGNPDQTVPVAINNGTLNGKPGPGVIVAIAVNQ
jgi:hypothetical protein